MIILTKRKDGSVCIQGVDATHSLTLTSEEWDELRLLTPESSALRKLYLALERRGVGSVPNLITATRDARALVSRMPGVVHGQ